MGNLVERNHRDREYSIDSERGGWGDPSTKGDPFEFRKYDPFLLVLSTGKRKRMDEAGESSPRDFASVLRSTSRAPGRVNVTEEDRKGKEEVAVRRTYATAREAKFEELLGSSHVDLEKLRALAWNGVPCTYRATCWRILSGYVPLNADRRESVLSRKRQEYADMLPEYYHVTHNLRSMDENATMHQISIDVPRTAPGIRFVRESEKVQEILRRVLYIRALRTPASGYVQGINDLTTPFLVVFLSEFFTEPMEHWDISSLSDAQLLIAEADSYWCLSKLLDGIQDHYTPAQPGIQEKVLLMEDLVRRIDEPLAFHLERQGVEYLQFAFRWVNCLLLRELPFPGCVLRVWDTYLAEGPRFCDFLVYVCASLLINWSEKLKAMDFQEIIMFLQRLPTSNWTEKEVEIVLSRAHMWSILFEQAKSHLGSP